MTMTEVLEIARLTVLTMLKIGAPVMLIALAVGIAVSLFQALTQMQEMTLTFVPKIIIIFVSMIFLLPFMMASLIDFGQGLFARMATAGV